MYQKFSLFQKISKFLCEEKKEKRKRKKGFHMFSGVFWALSTDFSESAWKLLKDAAFAVKIGVDTADILAFWAWNGFWYFRILTVFHFHIWTLCKFKRKVWTFHTNIERPTSPPANARCTAGGTTSWTTRCRRFDVFSCIPLPVVVAI